MTMNKKKRFLVRCTVNMDARTDKVVIVKTTKPHLACQKAEAELRNNGFFHAKAYSCVELDGDPK